MKVFLILFFILGVGQFIVCAQTPTEKTGCPVFSVEGSILDVDYDKPLVFRINIDRKLNPNEKLLWTVSDGKILSGQGTENISVENLSNTGMDTMATVEISGLPNHCEKYASSPTACIILPIPMKTDEFGKISEKILKEKIADFSVMLKEDPNATASIFKYFASRTDKSGAYRDLQTILNYLKSNGIDEERTIFQLDFEGDEKTEFWIVPAGAKLPSSELPNTTPEILEAIKLKQKIAELSKKQ